MSRRTATLFFLNMLLVFGLVFTITAQGPAGGAAKGAVKGKGAKGKGKGGPERPGLFMKEDWKMSTFAEHPVDQKDVAGANIELVLYNNTGEGMQMTGANEGTGNPPHIWTGLCEGPCAFGLRDKNNFVDLSGLGRIKANIKISGMHKAHPMVKLADGNYYVADAGVGTFTDWLEYDFALSDLRWLKLDPERVVTTGTWVNNPDLSKVDEIGFVDLIPGSGHGPGGWADVAQIEVYGKAVPR